jgi:hypothetical protein
MCIILTLNSQACYIGCGASIRPKGSMPWMSAVYRVSSLFYICDLYGLTPSYSRVSTSCYVGTGRSSFPLMDSCPIIWEFPEEAQLFNILKWKINLNRPYYELHINPMK